MRQFRPVLQAAVGSAMLLVLSAPVAPAALATPVENLRCLDDQLDDSQRAAIGSLFAEQTDDPTEERKLGNGTDAAAKDFAVAIGGCASRFRWNDIQQRASEKYLIKLGALSQIAVANGEDWAQAMEAYAPFGARLLPDDGEPNEHARAMIAAGSHASGVPQKVNDEAEDSSIVAYLERYAALEASRAAFAGPR